MLKYSLFIVTFLGLHVSVAHGAELGSPECIPLLDLNQRQSITVQPGLVASVKESEFNLQLVGRELQPPLTIHEDMTLKGIGDLLTTTYASDHPDLLIARYTFRVVKCRQSTWRKDTLIERLLMEEDGYSEKIQLKDDQLLNTVLRSENSTFTVYVHEEKYVDYCCNPYSKMILVLSISTQ